MGNSMNMHADLMVSVRCATYNHAPYIRQCLDGFVMQRTNFRFEVIVHDDASTDGTTDIVREFAERYPDIIKPMYEQTNQYSVDVKAMNERINLRLVGKYVAICEGDDYWTDPDKLQKQVDFLETHPDYSMCYHAVNYIKDGKVIQNDRLSEKECDVSVVQMIRGGGYFCSTNSLCFKQNLYMNPPKYKQMADTGDFPLQIHLALNGKVRYMPETMACYRVMAEGGWSAKANKEVIPMPHFLNMKEWMQELNRETKGRFQSVIYYFIVSLLFHPTKKNLFPRQEYLSLFGKISIFSRDLPLRSKYRALKYFLFFKCSCK